MRRTYANRHDVLGPAKTKPPRPGRRKRTANSRVSPRRKASGKEKEGHRETVEAIVVAFILALLVRGFEAEAFVIPTGSMAPTLMGRHKEITCPQCGYVYAVNASDEDEGRGARIRSGRKATGSSPGPASTAATRPTSPTMPSFKGDRILVMKFPYDLPFLPGRPAPSAGTSSSSATPRSPRSATSSGWSACPARSSGSSTATSTSSRPGPRSSSSNASRCGTSGRCR